MKVNENEFFRQATLKICGNLALEKALHSTLLYLRKYIPLDVLFIEYFDTDLGAARPIAKADVNGGTKLNMITPLSKEIRNDPDFLTTAILHQAVICNSPDENELATTMLRFHNYDEKATSILTMQLIEEGAEMFGGLAGVAQHRDAFTDEHARLLSMLAKPFKVAMVNALRHRDVIRLKDRLADDNRFLQREMHRISGDEIVGSDFGLKHVMEMVRQVASITSPVLLLGETGVGKDVIANAIHFSSVRAGNPFVAVNSGAIPEALVDSELFGHERGAFTGALSQKRGRFERANGGSIFLDEIGELPPHAQIRLLRVLQNHEVERVGGTKMIPVDVRIIAATHRNLEEMIADGHFREDLWFRLNVFPINIPPLRARPEDIPALVHHFIEIKAKQLRLATGIKPAKGELDRLIDYRWPGNVRELENVVERALILHGVGPLIFNLNLATQKAIRTPASSAMAPLLRNEATRLDDVISDHIRHILDVTGGKVQGAGGAAELLGVHSSTLRNRMRKLGIPYGRKK
jgi:formate hydrogenlyase transcriptional activator